ncbi:MAG: nicotinate-nucleotide--dimethylbenzimidazole phosphoribosyltransferase [Lachnospiraceae bacterium]|nr:nicotinate-nucleotide--dimethylbenzimidazole phosphoribosyltransferase [Lachnospiraceae bacterium]
MDSKERLQNIIDSIRPVDKEAIEQCKKRWDKVAKPLGGLGEFEDYISRIAAINSDQAVNITHSNINKNEVDITKKAVAVFASDNGVVKRGVSQCDSSVTANIVRSLIAGTSSVCVMAKAAKADVFVTDVGVAEDIEGVSMEKMIRSTDDICEGPAMTEETTIAAILTGVDKVKELKEKGYRLIATGEAGIGNTTTTAAMAAVLLGKNAGELTGRGAGLDDEGYRKKIEAIELAIRVNKPDNDDPTDIIRCVGGTDIAAMTGVFLGAAAYRIPVIMDGAICAVAALCACRSNPLVREFIIPSHMSGEPVMKYICKELDIHPVIDAGLHLGEGTGAVLMMSLLDTAVAVLNEAAVFEEINVEQYRQFRQ